jgi:hypothetical protein
VTLRWRTCMIYMQIAIEILSQSCFGKSDAALKWMIEFLC